MAPRLPMAHKEPQDPKKTLNNTYVPKVTQNSPMAPEKALSFPKVPLDYFHGPKMALSNTRQRYIP